MTAPTLHTIPATASFADALVDGLLAEAGRDPLVLARATVMLPTRRACRTVHEAFLRRAEGAALLLPRLVPLGDVDVDELTMGAAGALTAGGFEAGVPAAMDAARRQLLLARLIRRWGEVSPDRETPTAARAATLAAELARLMDQAANAGIELTDDRLKRLVPEEHADHWALTLDFLTVVTRWWPEIAAEEGGLGTAERRRRLLRAQIEAWRADPPEHRVIAAGATGAMPAAAELLDVAARLPRGAVILPGLDIEADAASWDAVRGDPTHPQHEMACLLDRVGVGRDAVTVWPGTGAARVPPARLAVVNAALKPASATPGWRQLAETDPEEAERLKLGLKGVTRLDCPGPREEAAAIALRLREALNVEGRTAALVTPDRTLARRVATALARWGIEVADSGGVPLTDTAPGTLLRLTARMLAEDFAPVPLLEALKHPLAAGGTSPGTFRARVRRLERQVLRGPRPAPGLDGPRAAVRDTPAEAELRPWLDGLETLAGDAVAALTPDEAGRVDLAAALTAHLRFAEALAATDADPGPARLWAGEEAAAFADEAARAAGAAPAIAPGDYPGVLDGLMQGRVVQPPHSGHPRLAIQGPLESRLHRPDRVVLGGLNEGTWPAETDPGPWLSRPMRARLGLPPVEARIGLMAHDFTQAMGAPEVVLTRATREGGTPTVPSRWLLRLDAVLATLAGPDDDPAVTRLRVGEELWLTWAARLDTPEHTVATPRPAPRPPLRARPRKLSVTRVETWLRDPYALYAEAILGLTPLDPVDQDPGAAEQGTLIHAALAAFAEAHPVELPAGPAAALEAHGREAFDRARVRPGVRAYWWPRFRRIAAWVAEREAERRDGATRVHAERGGRVELDGLPGGGFALTAKADRVEAHGDGRLTLVDHKTGAVPSKKEVAAGLAPQLPLEAAMARAGGFHRVPPGEVAAVMYWKLAGGDPAGEITALNDADPDAALDGLRRLIAAFDDPGQPYIARPRPQHAPRYSAYTLLARVDAWSSEGA